MQFFTETINYSFPLFQLKHCSRYIHDLFPSLIKNLDPVPLRHVLNLVSGLHPNAHTEQVQASDRDACHGNSWQLPGRADEFLTYLLSVPVAPLQTLYLASMLIKALWNNALAAKAQLSKQSSFASLLNTNIPMGNKKGAGPTVAAPHDRRWSSTLTKLSPAYYSKCFHTMPVLILVPEGSFFFFFLDT